MRIDIVSFSSNGLNMAGRVADALRAENDVHTARCGAGGVELQQWTAHAFKQSRALIFVGAAGIAVRAIAPHLAGKTVDPAVIVIDETGKYVIPILSGHIGGGNALASNLAKVLGAEPVITTATDRRGVIAFDSWAKQQGMRIRNVSAIKTVSAALLAGEQALVYSIFPIAGALPDQIVIVDSQYQADVVISIFDSAPEQALHLIPPTATLGIGCRKNTSMETIETLFRDVCREMNICPEAVEQAASIDLKTDEPGIIEFCDTHGIPFVTYSAAELAAVPGEFSASELVREKIGVDNVCERAAVLASRGTILLPKRAKNGCTMALALSPYTVRFGAGDENG